MPPSAPFSSGCGRQSVCEKYCCELWVLSQNTHTANRCYSEKNKMQTYPKREHFFPLPLITSLRPLLGGLPLETIQPLTTWAEAWQAIPGVSNWVLVIIKQGYTLQLFRLLQPLLHHPQEGSILDLRHLDRSLMKRPFRMITSKQILSQICPGDWFFSLDL